jgi:ribosomal protein RSM22 (predicted rRNA methylase)
MSTFYLSTLQNLPRQNHIKKLLSFKSPYLIIVDHARPQGWAAISKAREYILAKNTEANPLHIVAPCPHEDECPLLNTADICGFSQRVQSPRFLRKTKHSKAGEEDKGYVYLVVARGKRPQTLEKAQEALAKAGRQGGVAKEEEARRAQAADMIEQDIEGSVDGEIWSEKIVAGGSRARHQSQESDAQSDAVLEEGMAVSAPKAVQPEEMIQYLRTESYSWPRLVGPPFKKGGHVTFDACSPSGELTLSDKRLN